MRIGRDRYVCVLVVVAFAGGPHEIQAAAFQLRENSAVSLGTAFAGAGSAADTPATTFSNPAGLIQLHGTQIYLGGSLVAPSFTFHGQARDAFGRPIAGQNERDGGTLAAVPFAYVTRPITDHVAVGLAITSPFGLETYYGPGFAGRYQADKSQLSTIDVNPAFAVKVADWLSLGAGLSADTATAQFSSAINSQALAFAAAGRRLPLPDGLVRVRSENDWAFGYNVGALLTLGATMRVGLTYRGRIQHDFAGTADVSVPVPMSRNPALRSGPAGAKLVLPDSAGISLTHDFTSRWTGYADLTWTNWSVFRTLAVYRPTGRTLTATAEHYHDSMFVALGASYALTGRVRLRGGVGFDATPSDDAHRTARVPDANRYLLATGASWRLLPGTTLDLGYAHALVEDSRIRETSATGDVLSGHFANSIDVVSLGVRSAF